MLTSPVDPESGAPAKKPEEKKVEAAPAKKEDKPIRVAKTKPVPAEARPPVPKAADGKKPEAAPAAPVAPAPAAPAESSDEEFEKTLAEEERVLLDDSREAERLLGDKYKGQGTKMSKFLREAVKKELDVKAGDLSEAEYAKWYEASRPKIGALDMRQLQSTRATEAAKKEFEPKFEEERHTRWAEAETPKVQARATEVRAKIWESALPENIVTAVNEKIQGITDPKERARLVEEVKQEYALELEIAANITDAAREGIEEFYSLTSINPATRKPLKALRADAEILDSASGEWVPNLQSPNPEVRKQASVLAMISAVCDDFKNTGGLDLKKEGKWFATRKEYAGMSPDQRAAWWTFTDDEIITRAQGRVKGIVADRIQQEVSSLEKRGFKRAGAVAPAAAAPAVQPSGAPAAPRPSPPPAPNAAGLTPVQAQAKALAGKLESAGTGV